MNLNLTPAQAEALLRLIRGGSEEPNDAFLIAGVAAALERADKSPVRIETTDSMGNLAYFFRNPARGWIYASSSGIPLATSNWAHGKAMALQFALADAKTPEAALRAVKDHYHSGPALARARLV